MEYFKTVKPLIENFLKGFFVSKEGDFRNAGLPLLDVSRGLLEFASSGKMLRGGLVMLAHSLFRGKNEGDALKAAGAMELLQSGFLVHDDIMDRDTRRRGHESVFYRYKTFADASGFSDSYHFGESLGICEGDAAFFFAFEIISGLDRKIAGLFSKEAADVALAQMKDVYYGYLADSPGEEAVLNLYKYKTGRYTFSLPLVAGSILACMDEKTCELIGRIGESLGLIFQIKDDEIGLFGSEKETGKPAGSDIKENKKGLYRYYLFRMADPQTGDELTRIFGSGSITDRDLDFVREAAVKSGAARAAGSKISEQRHDAENLMGKLEGADPVYIKVMHELLEYSVSRKN